MNKLYRWMARNPAYQSACIAVTAYDIQGDVNLDIIDQALALIVKLNPYLGTPLDSDDSDDPDKQNCELEGTDPIDLVGLENDEQDAELDWILLEALEEPFDLDSRPLLRYRTVQFARDHWVILVLAHRAVFDEFSDKALIKAFTATYQRLLQGEVLPGEKANLTMVGGALTASSISRDQKSLHDARSYWQTLFTKAPVQLDLPHEIGLSTDPEYYTSQCSMAISAPLCEQLKHLIAEQHIALPGVFITALKLLLNLLADEKDIALTLLTNQRRPQADASIGPFSGMAVLRTDLAGDATLSALMARIQASYDKAWQYCDLLTDQTLGDLAGDPLHAWPWLQVLFRYEVAQCPPATGTAITVTSRQLSTGTSIHPLTFTLIAGHASSTLTLDYHSDRFSAPTAQMILDYYQAVLIHLVENAHGLTDEVPAILVRQMQKEFQAPSVPVEEDIVTGIGGVFRRVAKAFANRIAVKTNHLEWTYGQLARRAETVARAIIDCCGIGDGRVGLLFGQDPEALAATMGALIAGKTYIPMDGAMPSRRLQEIADDADLSLLLTNNQHAELGAAILPGRPLIEVDRLASDASFEPVQIARSPGDAAYIIYTSGSTGKPKGVVQSHENVLYHHRAYSQALSLHPNDRVTLLPIYTFDAAIMDIFGALLNGAGLHVFDLKCETSGEIIDRMVQEAVTIYHSTPTVYRYLLEEVADDFAFPEVRFVVLGGEAINRLDWEAYRRHFGNGEGFISTYSATESTVAMMTVRTGDLDWDQVLTAGGRPVAGTDILLQNTGGVETPLYGEILIRSKHVALGYWRQPMLTDAVFQLEPQTGLRVYRSGDMGRRLPDGTIRCCGRKDAQVKIRGNRVELGEIEAVLCEHQRIEQCAVVAITPENNADLRLHAVCRTPGDGGIPPDPELITFLGERLPGYMIPHTFDWVATLPMTASGKIDRRQLQMLL